MKKLLLFSYLTLYVTISYALHKDETCLLSISEQVQNTAKLKSVQKKLLSSMSDSEWIPSELVKEVSRTNEETFTGIDNILIRRNNVAKNKEWDSCNSPQFKYSAFESYILVKLAEANIRAIDVTNRYKKEITSSSGCSNVYSCNKVLFKYFRERQGEYSSQFLAEINIAKQKTINEINHQKNTKLNSYK